MRRVVAVFLPLCLFPAALAGFKVKLIKPKKPDQFQVRVVVSGVTWAADLLVSPSQQKDFFYKELTPVNVFAVRLAIFNTGGGQIVLPVERVELMDPAGPTPAASW